VIRVAAEGRDLMAKEFDRLLLIHDTIVASGIVRRLRLELGMSQKAERTHAIVESNHDHILGCKMRAIVSRYTSGATLESSTVDPEEHRELGSGGSILWRPDVHVQAVLRDVLASRREQTKRRVGLRTISAKVGSIKGTRPSGWWLWCSPSQVIDRRLGKWDTFVRDDVALKVGDGTSDSAIRGFDVRGNFWVQSSSECEGRGSETRYETEESDHGW
jgi:hypothetical protein